MDGNPHQIEHGGIGTGPRCDVDFILGPDGPFAQKIPGYEKRPGQMAYARAVEACMDPERNPERTPLLIEGPTGTGKTLGYLIPAIGSVLTRRFREGRSPGDPEWKDRRRVLVATSNIALQEQLIGKDLPNIRSMTGWDFDFTLLKGRSNYACHRAVEELKGERQEGLFPSDVEHEVARLKAWFEQSKTGDKSEVDPSPAPAAWSVVTSTADDCSKKKCPFYDACHYYGQRRAAWGSDVIVTNYAFLLTEIALRLDMDAPSVLMPEFDIVICDEAHDLGDIARRYFAKELKASQLRQMGRLLGGHRLDLKDAAAKAHALARLWNDMAQQRLDTSGGSVLYDPARYRKEAGEIEESLGDIAGAVRSKVLEYRRSNGLQGLAEADVPEGHRKVIDAMQRPGKMAESYIAILGSLFPKPHTPPTPGSSLLPEVGAESPERPEKTVYFIDGGSYGEERGQKNYSFVACPFSAGERLKAALWDTCERVVLTSATLATRLKADGGSRFGFVRSDLGLAETKCFEEIVESPFDFQRNMGVYIDGRINPQERESSLLIPAIRCLLQASRGRALVLFTSYRAMNEAHAAISPQVPFRCYKQGESSRLTLTTRFRDEIDSCLFATRSFFQGIDIQGESLSLLILDKLPFPMMNDPFIETAKVEGERTGKKWGWFDQHSIPRAMMAFRQAIGRLIRTQSDRGVVAILDSRIAAVGGKNYGRLFRDAIPSTQYLPAYEDVARFFGFSGLDDRGPGQGDVTADDYPDPSEDIPF